MKINASIPINQCEIEYLKTNGEKMPILTMAKHLNRSWRFVNKNLKILGIINKFDNSKKWIPNECEILILRSNISLNEMVIKLNRSIPSIRKQMRLMRLIEPAKKRAFNTKYYNRTRSVNLHRQIIPHVPRDGDNRIKEALMRIGII